MSAIDATLPSEVKATLDVAKIVGTPTNTSWAQIHTFVSDEPAIQKTHGELVAGFSVNLETIDGTPETDAKAVDVGRELLQRLQEEYFGRHDTDSPLDRLKQSVEVTVSQFSEGVKVEIVSAVIFSEYIYFCVWGGGKIFVWRDERLVTILSGRDGLSGTSSGKLQNGDIFILGTSAFDNVIKKETIISLLEKKLDQHEIVDGLAGIAHEIPQPALAAAMFKAKVAADASESFGEPMEKVEEVEKEINPVSQSIVDSKEIHEKARPEFYHEPTTIKLNQRSFLHNLLVNFAQKLPERSFKVDRAPSSSRKTAISVGILLLVLLSASIIFGASQKKTHDFKVSYASQLTSAETAYNDAVMQKDINAPHARELFQQAQDTINALLSEGIKDPQVDALKQKLDQDSGMILGKVIIPANLFLDLSVVRQNVSAREIVPDKKQVSVLDTSGARIITVGLQTKETNAVGGADKVPGAKTFAVGDEYYIFGDTGIVKLSSIGSATNVVKKDEEWGEITKVGFFGSSLYLLDKTPSAGSGQIWRYSASVDGFATKTAWLKGENTNFSNAVDLAIDGSLWVLSSDGKIQKFTRGVKDGFVLSGVDSSFTPTAFYTDEKLDNIYILDSGNKRILEVAKNGNFKKQYQADQIGQAVDLAVSAEVHKIFLLTPDKIFTIDLQ